MSNDLTPIENVEILDKVDDDAIVGMMTGQPIQDYVYSFKQGGKTVEGLTLAGINEAANRRGGIQAEDVRYEERDNSWLVIAKAIDTITGNSRYGAYEQSKRMGNRDDPHAFTKAVHKAQRNAVKQLLPVPVIMQVLNHYLHPDKAQKALPAETISTAQKSVFAAANEMKQTFANHSISEADFWNYVKRHYNVESRKEMTEEQWTLLSAELQATKANTELFSDLVEKIKQVLAAQELGDE